METCFYLDDIWEEYFKCEHEECPYKACTWHRYSLDDMGKYDFACKYSGVASMFPLIFENVKYCNMYLDE